LSIFFIDFQMPPQFAFFAHAIMTMKCSSI
jgi:hypothetical protein